MDVHTTLLPTLSAEVKARNHPQIPPPEIDMVRMWEINTWSCLIWHSNMLAGKTNAHNWRNSQGYKQMEHHSLTMARSNAPTLNIITLLTLRIKGSPRKLGIPELSVSRRRNTLITLITHCEYNNHNNPKNKVVASQARDSTVECKPQAQYCNNPNDAQTLEGQLNRPEHDCSYPLPCQKQNPPLSSNIRHGHMPVFHWCYYDFLKNVGPRALKNF